MAALVPGNAKSIMKQQWENDQKEWDDLLCPGKETIPINIQAIGTWITTITKCMKAMPGKGVQIEQDSSGHVVSAAFTTNDSSVNLGGGQLMDALGDNNDCLIHSFLTCVSVVFRKYDRGVRSKIASHFRRFVLPTIPGIDPNVRDRLRSYNFLTGGEIEFLSIHYQIPIVNLQDGDHEIERTMEIFPPREHIFWNGKDDTYTGPFYFIHGDNAHFTPVRFNGSSYEMRFNYGKVKEIADKITAEHASVFEAVAGENEKIEKAKEDFKGILQPDMASIKKEMAASNNGNKQTKSLKMSGMLEILKFSAEKYINDIIKSKIIDESLREKARTAIYTTLLDELYKNMSSTVNAPSSEKISKLEQLEKTYGQSGMSNADALTQAIKASLGESTPVSGNSTTTAEPVKPVTTPVSGNSTTTPEPVNPATGNSKILRTISNITAKIGNVSTQYSATVYKPVANAATLSTGGKHKTKKLNRAKKQKTKKLKKRIV
jgi:hypothetical protein